MLEKADGREPAGAGPGFCGLNGGGSLDAGPGGDEDAMDREGGIGIWGGAGGRKEAL